MSEYPDFVPEGFEPNNAFEVIAGNPSMVSIINALLDEPHARGLTITYIANEADVSRKTVHRYIDLIVELGILKEDNDVKGETTRYRVNPESEVVKALYNLIGAINSQHPENKSE